jgi:hypothetical protein
MRRLGATATFGMSWAESALARVAGLVVPVLDLLAGSSLEDREVRALGREQREWAVHRGRRATDSQARLNGGRTRHWNDLPEIPVYHS